MDANKIIVNKDLVSRESIFHFKNFGTNDTKLLFPKLTSVLKDCLDHCHLGCKSITEVPSSTHMQIGDNENVYSSSSSNTTVPDIFVETNLSNDIL